MDEYRKKKLRAQLSDSDSDGNDSPTKAPIGGGMSAFGGMKKAGNTPASSTYGGGSVAARSKASTM